MPEYSEKNGRVVICFHFSIFEPLGTVEAGREEHYEAL